MTTNILAAAVALPDRDLLTRIHALAGTERETSVELVAHLAALELRPSLYAAQGYGSLFAYCTQAVRLSEDAACNRIDAARVCLWFPIVLDLLASGSISLAAVRILKPHLTAENHEAAFARARNRTRREVEALVAQLAPRPEVPSSVRRLPALKTTGEGRIMAPPRPDAMMPEAGALPWVVPALPSAASIAADATTMAAPTGSAETVHPSRPATSTLPPSATSRARRPIVQALAPQRYRVQFTIDQQSHDRLQRLQTLLRREIPNGDAGAIFERALELLHDQVERVKLGVGARPRRAQVIRPGADKVAKRPILDGTSAGPDGQRFKRRKERSRHVPNTVRCEVWRRDAGQCAFVSVVGQRCTERNFLELHHIQPYALDGPATVNNISLRCRRHNQYEAELLFGPRVASVERAP